MYNRLEKDKQKLIQEKCQTLLTQMLRDEDNKYCVDCDAKGPRWASWNLGIFLCIRCAGIHRNLGVHISKVKSVNLDSWTPDQVACLQQMGNSRARAVYEANLPDNFRRPHTDSSLEAFVRAKYEQKKYIAKEWVPPPMPKVNWDLEIEEALKKKDTKKKPSANVEIPAPLPKPKANVTTGSLSAAAPVSASPISKESTAKQDLLSLDNSAGGASNDDPFGDFLTGITTPAPSSIPVQETVQPAGAAPTSNSTVTKKSSEEEDFFNQPSQTSGAESSQKLTKDSILALYSQGCQSQSYFGVAPPANPYQPYYQNQIPSANMYGMPNLMMGSQPQSMNHLQQSVAAMNLGSNGPPPSMAPGQGFDVGNPMGNAFMGQPMTGMPNAVPQYSHPNGQTLSTNLWQ